LNESATGALLANAKDDGHRKLLLKLLAEEEERYRPGKKTK
jgi:hypothetical protein